MISGEYGERIVAKKRRHKRRQGSTQRELSVGVALREGWGLALEVGGVTQSVSVPESAETGEGMQPEPGGGYWGLMLPEACPARAALLLGLGGGTVAHLLARHCPDAQMVGVERDAEVLALARERFGLAELEQRGQLIIVHADAFAWVAEQVSEAPADEEGVEAGKTPDATRHIEHADRFDLICLDLFDGGRLAQGALATPFLRQIAGLLSPEGTLTVNLMVTGRTPEQLHRLRRVFVVSHELKLRGNLVVHLRLPTTDEPLESPDGEGDA